MCICVVMVVVVVVCVVCVCVCITHLFSVSMGSIKVDEIHLSSKILLQK